MMPEAEDRDWQLLRTMLRMRRFEEAVFKLASEKAFAGHFHLYIGQEATGAAIMSVLSAHDRIATTHRNHGHLIARGADPARALAEILGRAGGLNGGRAGTLHLCEPALGFISTSAIVGGCISLAVGAGYACKQAGDGAVAVAFFGDGALEEGVSYEAMNVASLFDLPVVFVCENNSVDAWGTARGGFPSLVHGGSDLLQVPRSVGVAATRVAGNNAHDVCNAAADAVAKCRSGKGPVFIECITKRWPGSNPLWPDLVTGVTDMRMATGEVAIDGEHADWFRHHDPVLLFARELAERGPDAVAAVHRHDDEIRKEFEAAAAWALASPFPEASTALTHVFATASA